MTSLWPATYKRPRLANYPRVFVLLCWCLSVVLAALPAEAAAPTKVTVLRIQGVINPVAANYVARGLSEAKESGARVLVIELNTPGGLDTSMREIIQTIVNSPIPVIVYVSPAGGRAASAGLFITTAAHVAAMAPDTNIGAAHPVNVTDGLPLPNISLASEPVSDKVTNDAVAYIRGLAERRGRNADWAEKAVRESVSVPANAAANQKTVDLVVADLDTLLQKVDGRKVEVADGPVTLQTANVTVDRLDMNLIERLLYVISDPTIAYILLTLGTYGLIFELTNPGAVLPGVLGAIFLIIGLLALGTMPINYAGLLLMALGIVFFVAEVKVMSHGVLTVGGAISFLLGSLILINSDAPYYTISRSVILTTVVATTLFFVFVIGKAIAAQRRRPATGLESMIGRIATTRTPLAPTGMVYLEGELWRARSLTIDVPLGANVEVVGLAEGMELQVKPMHDFSPLSSHFEAPAP